MTSSLFLVSSSDRCWVICLYCIPMKERQCQLIKNKSFFFIITKRSKWFQRCVCKWHTHTHAHTHTEKRRPRLTDDFYHWNLLGYIFRTFWWEVLNTKPLSSAQGDFYSECPFLLIDRRSCGGWNCVPPIANLLLYNILDAHIFSFRVPNSCDSFLLSPSFLWDLPCLEILN